MPRNNPFRGIYDSETYKGVNSFRFPDIVDIELTNNCNLNCKMCARQNMTRFKGFMSKKIFEQVAIECAKYGSGLRMIGWGEPFLHKDIIDFCEFFKSLSSIDILGEEKPSMLHITNNGQIIREDQMKRLVDIGLDSIIFSFQGVDKDGYEGMRVGASYEKIKENILKLVEIRGDKEKPLIHISSTMTNETKDEISKFVDYWEKIVDSVGVGKTKPLKLNNEEYTFYKPCQEVFHKLSVKWDGQVSACCADTDNELVVGSLSQNTLYEIWNNSKVLQAIRTLLSNNKFRTLSLCRNCSHAYEDF